MIFTQITYDIGSLTDWFSAIGTLAAVIVALYLARRRRKPLAHVKADIAHYVSSNGQIYDKKISAKIINIGEMPFTVEACSVETKKKQWIAFADGSHEVKGLLNPGEQKEAILDYSLIKEQFLRDGLKKKKINVFFRDSTRKRYRAKLQVDFHKE